MSLPWFRFYHEALDDPKVQKLDPGTFKHWVNLLCIACRNGGKLPAPADLAFALRIDEIALESLLDRLLIATLIEVRKGGQNGSYIAMHGWEKRQFKSDNSTERVKRFRNVTVTADETPPETETETETEEPPLSPPKGAEFTRQDVLDSWNEIAALCGLAKVVKLTESRKRRLDARMREYPDAASWKAALRHIREAPFLHGDSNGGWRADFDFFLQAKSFTKLVEGSYGKAN